MHIGLNPVSLVLRWIPIGIVALTHGHRGVMLGQTPLRVDPFEDIRGLNGADHRDGIARIDDVFHTAHPGHLVGEIDRDRGERELDLLRVAEDCDPALFDGGPAAQRAPAWMDAARPVRNAARPSDMASMSSCSNAS